MELRRWSLAGLVMFLACLVMQPSPARSSTRDQHWTLFFLGLRSWDFHKDREAVQYYSRAIQLEPRETSDTRLRVGTEYPAYLPHFWLGRALAEVGTPESLMEAIRSFDESEHQGIVQNYKELWGDLRETRQRIREELFPREMQRIRGQLDAVRTALRAWSAPAPVEVAQDVANARGRFERAQAALDAASSNNDFGSLLTARENGREAWSILEALRAAEVSRLAGSPEQARDAYARAVESLKSGQCSEDAVRVLEGIADGAPSLTGPGQSPARPLLLLADAHLACGRVERAQDCLDRARARGECTAEEASILRERIDTRRGQRDFEARLGETTLASDSSNCERVIQVLTALRADAFTARAAAKAQVNLPVLLSQANLACAHTDAATRWLDAARSEGAPTGEVDALAAQIRRAAAGRSAEARRSYLVDLYGSASRELEAGGCQRSAIASLIEVLGATEPLGLAGGDQPAPSFLLGRAYLGCNDLGSAERYLDAAQEAGEVPQAKLQSAREDLRLARQAVETKRQILATVSDYLALRALVDLGSCNREATSALESSLSASALPGEPMQPHLLLAKAYRLCGDRDGVRRHLDPARREASPESAEIASYEAWLAQPPGAGVSSLYAHSYALVVGVASYKDPSWSDLRSVTAEVEGVVRVLKAHQFEVQPLLSPTKAQLERAMADFFEKKRGRGANNRLVFYFAGHGWTELNRRTPLGYIVPADTPSVPDAVWDEVSVARAPGAADVAARPVSPDTNFNYMQYLISMDVFRTYAREARASHVIFIFDSCFSGTVFDATGSQMEVSSRGSSLLEQVLEQPVRVFITAGEAHESVPGKSFFEPAIEKGLEGDADLDGDGVILGTEVGRYAARHGSSARNTPRWGLFDDPNYARGDIAFKNLRGASGDGSSSAKGEMSPLVAGTLAEIDYWKGVLDAPGVASISGYLATYPAGVFGTVASRMLERQDELNLPK